MSHGSHNSHGSYTNHRSHGNHANYADNDVENPDGIVYPNTGEPKVEGVDYTWNNWGTLDNDEYISDSVNKIKELRDKITYLHDNHGGGTWETAPDNPAISNTEVSDDEFDGVGEDYVDDIHYDTLKNNMDILTNHLLGTGTGLPDYNEGDYIDNEHFAQLKAEIDSLASQDFTAQYSNHHSHDDHDNHDNHGSHGSHGSSSDRRLKENIELTKYGLKDLQKLTAVDFTWKDSKEPSFGLIAQEVQKVFPEIVSTDSDGYLQVDYSLLVVIVIKALQEIQSE